MKQKSMYTVAVTRCFTAYHFLVGGAWGAENERHAHMYKVEVQIQGPELDKHGYLVDITAIEKHLENVIARYREKTLNELPEFRTLNPSIEHFARIMCEQLSPCAEGQNLKTLAVTIWENEIAWARYATEL